MLTPLWGQTRPIGGNGGAGLVLMRCFEPLGLGALLYCELVTHSTGLLHQGRLVARPAPQLQEVFGLLSELSGEAPRNKP